MCPDRDLVSAYVDGEVPSPWRERLEEHLGSCVNCAALAARYSRLGERLRTELASDGVAKHEIASLARGRARLDALLEGRAASRLEEPLRDDSPRSWRRSVSLPLPLAAAAAVLAILLGGATAFFALRPGKGAAIQTIASGQIAPLAIPASSQPSSMDELLRYLNAQGGEATLTIKLPTAATFGTAGKPVIMRSGQNLRVTPSGTQAGGSSP